MYNEKQITKYDYFKKILKKNKIEYILDPLTGAISRRYFIEFIKDLVSSNTKFTLAIIDLDDFKTINDKYGHLSGDYILEHFSENLIDYVGDNGLVGRFGGDEFLIAIFGIDDYDDIHAFYQKLFNNILRNHYIIGQNDIYTTGTLGSARFPEDAATFEELFVVSDKTLYRGKMKGRNCYIIYVHEKHKDLKIESLHKDDLAIILFNINTIFDEHDSFEQKMMDISEYLKDNLRLDNIYYIDQNKTFYDALEMKKICDNIDLSDIRFNNELYKRDYHKDVNKLPFGPYIENDEISSLLITRIKDKDEIKGYIMFALKRMAMIWHNQEIATLLYLAKTISLEIELNKNK